MKNPLDSLWGTVIAGVVLTAVLYVFAETFWVKGSSNGKYRYRLRAVRWVHFMAGIMWIAAVLLPTSCVAALKNAGADGTARASQHVARAHCCSSLGCRGDLDRRRRTPRAQFSTPSSANGMGPIGIGAWLGTNHAVNVWVLIWPNQKKILGMVSATDDEKNRRAASPFLASAHQHHAVDSDAVLHGNRDVSLSGFSSL